MIFLRETKVMTFFTDQKEDFVLFSFFFLFFISLTFSSLFIYLPRARFSFRSLTFTLF